MSGASRWLAACAGETGSASARPAAASPPCFGCDFISGGPPLSFVRSGSALTLHWLSTESGVRPDIPTRGWVRTEGSDSRRSADRRALPVVVRRPARLADPPERELDRHVE